MKSIVMLDVPSAGSLLSSAAQDFLLALSKMLEPDTSSQETVICLRQTRPCLDELENWANELQEEALHKTLYERIVRFQQLLNALRQSGLVSIYLSYHSTVDSYWDLALACNRRAYITLEGYVGFTQTKQGLSSLNANFATTAKHSQADSEQGLQQNKLSLEEANRLGLIDYWADSFLEEEAGYGLRSLLSALCSKKASKTALQQAPSTAGFELTWLEARGLSQRWSAKKKLANESSTPLGLMRALKKQKKFFDSPAQTQSLFAFELAHFLLAGQSFPELSPQPKEYELLTASFHTPNSTGLSSLSDVLGCVFVQADTLAPPLRLIQALLVKGYTLAFYASTAEPLALLLNRMYLRLSQLEGWPRSFSEIWTEQISWFVSSFSQAKPNYPLLHCGLGDRLSLSYKETTLCYLNLAGNQFSAPLGYWEALPTPQPAAGLDPEQQALLDKLSSSLSLGLISPVRFDGGCSLSCWVRLHFLAELLKLAAESALDFEKVLTLLENQGWGFAASLDSWLYFLRTWQGEPKEASCGLLAPAKEVTELASLRQLQAFIKNTKRSTKQSLWQPASASLHLGLFAIALAKALGAAAVLTALESERLVAASLGFPLRWESLSRFESQYGSFRFEAYVKKHWSKHLRRMGPNN